MALENITDPLRSMCSLWKELMLNSRAAQHSPLKSCMMRHHDICCLVTLSVWQTEKCTALEIPGYSRHSICRPVKQRGPIRGGICVHVAS